jgi:S-adenosylmethionine-diacylgycerolhomoserine-N-methlytransferase
LALEAGLKNLAPGRTLYIVDFWDQADLPVWFAKILKGWLRRFGVFHKPELLAQLRAWESQNLGTLKVQSVARRYAYIAAFTKAA